MMLYKKNICSGWRLSIKKFYCDFFSYFFLIVVEKNEMKIIKNQYKNSLETNKNKESDSFRFFVGLF